VRDELAEVRAAHATPRKTEILEADGDMEDEDLIQREDMVVTVSHAGYVKRVPLATYRAQRRGGKGRSGMTTKEEDFVTRLFVASTHAEVLFFSSAGQVYKMKVWRLPLSAPQGRGKAFVNLLPLDPDERITSVIVLPEDAGAWERNEIMFATTGGTVRRNALADFMNMNRNGKIAMKLEDGEAIAAVDLCGPQDDVLLTTANGNCIRFPIEDVRVFKGRDSVGVRGIRLDKDDTVISMAIIRHVEATAEERASYLKLAGAVRRGVNGDDEVVVDAEDAAATVELGDERFAQMGASEQFILTVSERGFGKRSSSFEYRITGRGGKGIVAMAVNKRNGKLVASFPVEDADQLMLITDGGQTIRVPVDGIRITGRGTQGVTVFKTGDGEKVVSVERISEEEEAEDAEA
jgi:DNA gyrase subunit A